MGPFLIVFILIWCVAIAIIVLDYATNRVYEETQELRKEALKEEYIRRKLRDKREGY